MISETTSKPGVPRVFTAAWGVLALNVACCLLWGSAFPCVKMGYRLPSVDVAEAARASTRRRPSFGSRLGNVVCPYPPYTKRGSGVVTSRVHGRSSRTMGGTA